MALRQFASKAIEAVGKAVSRMKAPATQALKTVKEAYKGKQGFFAGRQKYKLMKNIVNKDFKKTAARAAAVASVARAESDAKSQAAKYNYQAQIDALDRYNQIINQKSTPAPDTGNPETGTPNGPTDYRTGDQVYPTGK